MRQSLGVIWEVARRLQRAPQKRLGRLGALLAVGSVALAVAVMEVGLGIAAGFEEAIQGQLSGLSGDLQLGRYRSEFSRELLPIASQPDYLPGVVSVLPPLKGVYPVARKAALLQAGENLEGVLLKGMPATWNPALLPGGIVLGRTPAWGDSLGSREILISTTLARRLGLAVEDRVRLFFPEERVRVRPATVVGFYDTGLEEYDAALVLCDLSLVQGLHHWADDEAEYLELHLERPLDSLSAARLVALGNDKLPPELELQSIHQLYPDLFSWIGLQHQNIRFLIGIMFLVGTVNLASALLLRVTEQLPTVGLLNALGATPGQLIRLFLSDTAMLLGMGILWGNALGLGLLSLQAFTDAVPLPTGAYFVESVPVGWPLGAFLRVNLGIGVASLVSFLLPAIATARIRPVSAFRFR